jgi:hypothetical protein
LTVTARDAGVTLDEAAFEWKGQDGLSEETSYRPNAAAGTMARTWFGDPRFAADTTRVSGLIELPATSGRTLLVKVKGRDDDGRPVGAYAEIHRDAQ